ncbi:MAG TPA: EAL domain-containing protein [Solirubrobacterales bacterium]|nr:EAL domain-containing protein [Solirubrobacterales bacterium]
MPADQRESGDQRDWRFDVERDLICVADRDGQFVTLNMAWETVLGWPRDELLKRRYTDLVHPADIDRTAAAAGGAANDGERLVDFENRCRHRDGSYRWLRWSARSDGEQWFAVAFDITAHKQREDEVRRLLAGDNLLAYGQPIVDLRTDRVEHEELLVRMRGEGGEAIVPGQFLPEVEELGLVGVVDTWMLERAIEAAHAGATAVHVNLSQRTLGSPELVERIHEIVAAGSDVAPRLVFEITETAAVETLEAARNLIAPLLPLGCRFALDDFGTGYGSLTYLRHLPVRFVKIDIRFVRHLLRNPEDQALVRSVVALAGELGLETIAEGVENEPTLEALREYGVDFVQGYVIGRPAPLDP